jgi:hypothetical protein
MGFISGRICILPEIKRGKENIFPSKKLRFLAKL